MESCRLDRKSRNVPEDEPEFAQLCEVCDDIFSGRRSPTEEDRHLPMSLWFKFDHYRTWLELRGAVAQGCSICCRLYDDLTKSDGFDSANLERPGDEGSLQLCLTLEESSLTVFLSFGRLNQDSMSTWFTLGLYDGRGSLMQRPEHGDTGSVPTFTWARRCLSECVASHPRCNEDKNASWYPRRLLDIGCLDGLLRMVQGSHLPLGSTYFTLSHRWGSGKHMVKLHADKLAQFQSGFDKQLLPQTFRDFITAAHRLGARYVWIDSLCIIQEGDNFEDWKRQASTMKDVYMNATCNISADWSTPDSGLFFTRDYMSFQNITIRHDTRLWTLAPLGRMSKEVQGSPLGMRGWVMQERILARKCLHFCRHEVFWECCETVCSESYPILSNGAQSVVPTVKDVMAWKNIDKFMMLEGEKDTRRAGMKSWHSIVEHYSACQLTHVTDKLVAISGVAQYLKPYTQSRYVAGLWEDFLLQGLAWRPDVSSPTRGDPGESDGLAIGTDAVQYHAPSFSWASCAFPVEIWGHEENETYALSSHASFVQLLADDPILEDIFGPLSTPCVRLRLSGILTKVRLDAKSYRPEDAKFNVYAGPRPFSTYIGPCKLDFNVPKTSWDSFLQKTYFLIPILSHRSTPASSVPSFLVFCLVLELLDDKRSEFRRIGSVLDFVKEGEANTIGLTRLDPECKPTNIPADKRGAARTIYVL